MFEHIRRVSLSAWIVLGTLCSLLVGMTAWAITRQEIASRAQVWVTASVPYSQSTYRDGYRTDCSGYVSYSWNTRTSSGAPANYVTDNLATISSRISKDSLQSGDILLNADSHVLIFDRWQNSDRSYYYAYEMTRPNAIYRRLPYPYWSGYGTYLPYRYNGISNPDSDDGRTLSYGQTLQGTISPSGDRDDYSFSGSANSAITLRMSKSGSSLDSYLELYRDGRFIGSDDDRGGDLNSLLVVTLPESGTYRVVARAYSSGTGGYTIQLSQQADTDPDDGRWFAYGQSRDGTISPSDDRDTYYFGASAGRVVSIRMDKRDSGLDPFVELFGPDGSRVGYNDDGGGALNSWLVATLPSNGTYRILVHSYGFSSSGRYNLSLGSVTASNLALNRPAWAESVEFSGVEPARAVDGNINTRWSSLFHDFSYIVVDLGSDRTINQVVLRWEAAYGRTYGIQVLHNNQWSWVWYTTSGDGGVDTCSFSPVAASAVAMVGTRRGTVWGYSLHEFEVYNTAATVIPMVPPPDPGKTVGNLGEAPLPPAEPGKEIVALTLGTGEDAQENSPLLAEFPSGEPIVPSEQDVQPPVAQMVLSRQRATQGIHLIDFVGSGNDGGDQGSGISTCRWTSSLDGPFGAGESLAFTWPAEYLSVGTHTIAFSVRDDAANWSEAVTTTLTIEPSFVCTLPIILH